MPNAMALFIQEKIFTQRLVLDRLQLEDSAEIFYTYASKAAATKFMAWPTHQTIDDTHTFLNATTAGWDLDRDYSFAIREKTSHRMIGSCGMLHEEGRIQFGYVLGPLHWGHGYATEATTAMLAQLKNQTEIFNVETFVDAENVASLNVLKKCGLVEDARLEKWFSFPNQNNAVKDCVLFRLPR